ncbi:hypothetical protein ARMSODRAFT_342557 [Armillaria solidipes]|uniref:Uncharacterized protein n=1 Tax=Armillaria solidipes TaxID=1076256 RepID=A0A2H3BSA4_9AGAR|nr:hypothetical protein ARMSODRAFT_342557 [Armillaria solidipes]
MRVLGRWRDIYSLITPHASSARTKQEITDKLDTTTVARCNVCVASAKEESEPLFCWTTGLGIGDNGRYRDEREREFGQGTDKPRYSLTHAIATSMYQRYSAFLHRRAWQRERLNRIQASQERYQSKERRRRELSDDGQNLEDFGRGNTD